MTVNADFINAFSPFKEMIKKFSSFSMWWTLYKNFKMLKCSCILLGINPICVVWIIVQFNDVVLLNTLLIQFPDTSTVIFASKIHKAILLFLFCPSFHLSGFLLDYCNFFKTSVFSPNNLEIINSIL